MTIKYFGIPTPSGSFNVVERQVLQTEVTTRGYPVRKVAGAETLKEKRLKQIDLPLTGAIRVYAGFASAEFGSSIEYG